MGMLDFLFSMANGYPGLEDSRKDVIRTELENGVVIDTCCAFDTGKWETAVCRDEVDVAEVYESREEAVIGHEKWCERLTENPDLLVKDLTMDRWLGEDFGLGEDDERREY